MKLTKKQFDVLTFLEGSDSPRSQRELAAATGISVGSINKIVSEMSEAGYITSGKITDKGIEALEPYRVKKAIFIAAGFGSRLVPITLNTPKPLVARIIAVIFKRPARMVVAHEKSVIVCILDEL